jgi:hypothetical protein
MGKLLALLGVLGLLWKEEVSKVQAATPTTFGYEGQLSEGSLPADGLYDIRATLFDASSDGTIVGGPVTNLAVQVHQGLFTTTLDFGLAPIAGTHWIGLAVRRFEETAPFTDLLPRQPITAVPSALRTAVADEARVAHSLVTRTPSTAPSVVLAPAHTSPTPVPGGVAWLDANGTFAGGIVADTPGRLDFNLTRPLYVSGAPLIVSSGSGARPLLSSNILQVLGNAQVTGTLQALGGIRFPDGSRLDSSSAFQQPNVLWVSTSGDDSTATRGNPALPWKTLGIAVSNALSGDAILMLPGTYPVATVPELGAERLAAPIRVVGLTNVTIAGFGGTPEIYAPDFGDIIQVASCYNLTFRNLHLRSDASKLAAPPHGQSAGICFRPDSPANARILIDGCRFTGVPHAITTFAAPAVITDHLTVRDCTFIDCGWTTGVPTLGQDGGALTGFGNHLRFVNNTLDGAIRGVEFYRFPGDPGHTNALISGNIFLNYWDCAICSFDDGDDNAATLDSVVIADNLFEDAPNELAGGEVSGSAAILINSGRRITIRGNLVNRGKIYGIKVSALTGPLEHVDITANAVSDVAGRGVQITDYGPGVQHVRVTNNRLWGNSGGGLLAQGQFLDLSFNDITANYPSGIRVMESETGQLTSSSRVYGNFLIGNASAMDTTGTTNLIVEANHVIEATPPPPDTNSPSSVRTLSSQRPRPANTTPGTSPEPRPPRRIDALRAWQAAADEANAAGLR